MPTVAVLMTTYNRAAITKRALSSLREQELPSGWQLALVAVDDASTDDTLGVLQNSGLPDTTIRRTPGDFYWCKAMALAESIALELGRADYFLWLNDDVVLESGAVARAIRVMLESRSRAIVVGALTSASGELSYSGLKRAATRPTRLVMAVPGIDNFVDTFNGNFVLVPRHLAVDLGGIDSHFEHAYGDLDYGLRASAVGIDCVLLDVPVGTCPRDSDAAPWLAPHLRLTQRFRTLISRKGLPPRSQWRYLRRHGGMLFPAYFLLSYLSQATKILSVAVRAHATGLR